MTAARGEPRPGFARSDAPADGHGRLRGLSEFAFEDDTVHILEEDPDLAADLTPADRFAASRLLKARVMQVTSRHWDPPGLDPARTFGLLVMDGLLGRRVQVGRGVSTELLSFGDILRPWDKPTLLNLVPPKLGWRVFRPTRLAVLDAQITAVIGRRPELIVAFSGRLLRRARHTAHLMAIGHHARVEDRLLLTLWHLASNWGRVTPEGVSVPFRLTHEVLGEIIGAQRPSVTMAVGVLRRRGELIRRDDGYYVLTGSPQELIFERERRASRR